MTSCTCSASRYDGDDGWDRDCPSHGVNEDCQHLWTSSGGGVLVCEFCGHQEPEG